MLTSPTLRFQHLLVSLEGPYGFFHPKLHISFSYILSIFIGTNFKMSHYRKYSSLKNSICRICILFVLTYTGHLYPCDHENLFIWLIMSYVLTSLVSGYKATSFHSGFTPHGRVMVQINVYCISVFSVL